MPVNEYAGYIADSGGGGGGGARGIIGRTGGVTTNVNPIVSPGASGVSPAGGMNLTDLTNYINQLNRKAQADANAARIPHGADLEKKSSANIANELSGVVPPDVLRMLQQQAAERGVSTGVGGMSANNNAAYLQALGLTSIGLQHQGQADLSGADARNPAAHIFDPSTQLITPYDAANLAQQRDFERDRMDLERQRLALEAATHGGGGAGGGGGYRGGGGGGGFDPFDSGTGGLSGPGMVVGGPTGTGNTYIPASNPTESWWNSIGFNPNIGAGGGSGGPGSYTFGSDVIDPSLFAGTGSTSSTGGGVDWGSLFSPSLGIDPSLYTGG